VGAWALWHSGNEKDDKLARQGAATPLLGPQLALGILEYLGVQQEELLSASIVPPGIIYQVIDMVTFFLVDHVRKELKACLY
jgi:hypothetical protein